jgi:hypothetical protein
MVRVSTARRSSSESNACTPMIEPARKEFVQVVAPFIKIS